MEYRKVKDIKFGNYAIVSDVSCTPIAVTETGTGGIKVADIKIDGHDNYIYIANDTVKAVVGISDYYNKTEVNGLTTSLSNTVTTDYYDKTGTRTEILNSLSNYYNKSEINQLSHDLSNEVSSLYLKKADLSDYFKVVDTEPTSEEQAANPNVIWLVKKQ